MGPCCFRDGLERTEGLQLLPGALGRSGSDVPGTGEAREEREEPWGRAPAVTQRSFVALLSLHTCCVLSGEDTERGTEVFLQALTRLAPANSGCCNPSGRNTREL